MSPKASQDPKPATVRGATVDREYQIIIEAGAWLQMLRLTAEDPNVETGGILVGRYSADRSTAIVSEATAPPPDSRRGRSWFVRGVIGLTDLLRRRWREETRRHYVGEWHYHPATTIEPSGQDLSQMIDISRAAVYQCREPILVIVGRSMSTEQQPAVRMFVHPAAASRRELIIEPNT